MTATIIPYAVFKARLAERKVKKSEAGLWMLIQRAAAQRMRERIQERADCGDCDGRWPKWDDFT
jgi:hypothetical protein